MLQVITHNAAVSPCEEDQRLLAAIQVAYLVPNAITHNAAISFWAKAQQWHQGLGHLAAMQEASLVPDVTTYLAASG